MKIIRSLSKFTAVIALLSGLAITSAAQQPVTATGTNVLKRGLQAKLDEWHKAGKFPGATLGVVLPDGESFGLATGHSDRDTKTPIVKNHITFSRVKKS